MEQQSFGDNDSQQAIVKREDDGINSAHFLKPTIPVAVFLRN